MCQADRADGNAALQSKSCISRGWHGPAKAIKTIKTIKKVAR
jgi:hypothetical protein